MDQDEVMYQLLHRGLEELRLNAARMGDHHAYAISNVLQDLPLYLQAMRRGEISSEEIWRVLAAQADEAGCRRWLRRTMDLASTERRAITQVS